MNFIQSSNIGLTPQFGLIGLVKSFLVVRLFFVGMFDLLTDSKLERVIAILI